MEMKMIELEAAELGAKVAIKELMNRVSKTHIKLTPAEIQSGLSRQRYAEMLIEQLPANHDGRNSWLMNYGTGEEAKALQQSRGLWLDPEFGATGQGHGHVAGTMVGKHIDECAKCGQDIRHPIHARSNRQYP